MKKLLLTTTALGLFAAGSALAEGPTVTLGGYADFQAGAVDQDTAFTSQGATSGATFYSRDLHTRTDTSINIKVDGKTDAGLGYGAYVELEADTSEADNTAGGTDGNAERTYLYVESGFGRVEAGATGDAAEALRVDASTFASATGGIAGDFYKYVDLSNNVNGVASGDYYILPGLLTAAGLPGEANGGALTGDIHSDRANANKVSYYSPRIQGVQGGVSFTPDQEEKGTASQFAGANSGSTAGLFENVWNLGVNYEGQFNDVGIAASATGEIGDSKADITAPFANYDDLQSYALGANLSYAGFTVGGSYGISDEFGQIATNGAELDYYTLGAGYEFGPFGTSVTYLASTVENSALSTTPDKEFTNLSLGADYKLAPGLVPYIEVSFVDTEDNTAATPDNNGTVFIVGTALTF